ncbi:MAG: 6-bladed beta-propeller, partial [Calditrichaeota bacterium]
GNIYVLDGGNCRIQKFDAQGNYSLTIGRKGQGPGEFEQPTHFALTPDERILVYDAQRKRLSVFSTGGEFLRDLFIGDKIQTNYSFSEFFVWPDGDVLLSATQLDPEKSQEVRTFYRLTLDEFRHQQLFSIRYPVWLVQPPQGGAMGWADLIKVTVATDTNRNVYVSYQKDYVIEVYSGEGKLQRRIYRKFAKVPYSEEERRQMAARPSFVLNGKEYYKPVPEFKDDIQGMVARENGELWVLTSQRLAGDYVIDVFDARGRFVRQLRSEEDFPFAGHGTIWRPGAVWKGGRVYALVTDEDGLIAAKRYRFEMLD